MTDAALTALDGQWKLGLHDMAEDWTTEDRRKEAAEAFAARIDDVDDAEPGAIPALQDQLRALVGRRHLPVVPVVGREVLPNWVEVADGKLDAEWLEIVAAVRPRVAALEAHQLTASQPWPAAILAPAGAPWGKAGPVHIAYGPALAAGGAGPVGVALLDRWVDSVPSQHHVTQAAFGFNAPKTRAPNAVLVAVPPDTQRPLEGEDLLRVVMQVQPTSRSRAPRAHGSRRAPVGDALADLPGGAARRYQAGVAVMTNLRRAWLEPGRTDPEAGLRAEVADPVWFLARQWELGEFQGEDASSPVRVILTPQQVPLRYDATRPHLDPTVIPGEALIEAEPGDWWTVGRRARAGSAVAPLLGADDLDDFRFGPLPAPYEELSEAVDGRAVFVAGVLAGHTVWRDLGVPSPPPDRFSRRDLSYTATFSAGGTGLEVREHRGGDVDWFSVELGAAPPVPAAAATSPIAAEVVPTRLTFPGAPHPRWWQIEDVAVDLGAFAPDRSHLATMLLSDLAVADAEDWFVFPCPQHPIRWNEIAPPTAGVLASLARWCAWSIRSARSTTSPRPARRVVALLREGSRLHGPRRCGRWPWPRTAGRRSTTS